MKEILIPILAMALVSTSAKAETSEKKCLATAIYHEAKGESYLGKKAVGNVVINRTEDKRFPKSICNVVYQRSNRGCQFSWVCTGTKGVNEGRNWQESVKAAEEVLQKSEDVTNGALYFWSTRIAVPRHAIGKARIRIGGHYFAK